MQLNLYSVQSLSFTSLTASSIWDKFDIPVDKITGFCVLATISINGRFVGGTKRERDKFLKNLNKELKENT